MDTPNLKFFQVKISVNRNYAAIKTTDFLYLVLIELRSAYYKLGLKNIKNVVSTQEIMYRL